MPPWTPLDISGKKNRLRRACPVELGIGFNGTGTDIAQFLEGLFGGMAALNHQTQQDHTRATLTAVAMGENPSTGVQNIMGVAGYGRPVMRGFGHAKIADREALPGDIAGFEQALQVLDVVACHFFGLRGADHQLGGPFYKRSDVSKPCVEPTRQGGDAKGSAVFKRKGSDFEGHLDMPKGLAF